MSSPNSVTTDLLLISSFPSSSRKRHEKDLLPFLTLLHASFHPAHLQYGLVYHLLTSFPLLSCPLDYNSRRALDARHPNSNTLQFSIWYVEERSEDCPCEHEAFFFLALGKHTSVNGGGQDYKQPTATKITRGQWLDPLSYRCEEWISTDNRRINT